MKDREYHFCNMNCRSLWQKNHFKGSNNPNYNPNLTDQNREDRRKIKNIRIGETMFF